MAILEQAEELAVAEITSQERSYLERRHPQLAGHRSALVVAVDDAEVLALTRTLVAAVAGHWRQMHQAIEALMPPAAVPGRAAVLQARRNAEARAALLAEFGALTSSEVADLAGSRARNRAALANRWRKEGRILAVSHRGQTLYPGFQLDEDGRPRPEVAEVLAALGEGMGAWEVALWFTSASGWLGGARPVDLLDREPERVVAAARREAQGLVF